MDNKLELIKYRDRLCRDHRQLVEDHKKYAGQSCQPSWALIEDSAKQIMQIQEEIEAYGNRRNNTLRAD